MTENEFFNTIGNIVDEQIVRNSEVLREYMNVSISEESDIHDVIIGASLASIRFASQIAVQTVMSELLSLNLLNLQDVPENFHSGQEHPSRSIFQVIDGRKSDS